MKEFVLNDSPSGKALKIDYAKELNAEQLDVVLHGDGPCLVLAGAGSGKTRTITYRVAYLLEQGVRPDEILLLTFTNKAAREMLSRVESLLAGGVKGIWGGTFHGVANRLLRTYATEIGHSQNFTILDSEDSKDLIKLCLKDIEVDTTSRRFPSAANLLSILSFARNARHGVRDTIMKKHPHFLPLEGVISRIAELYEARKKSSDAMDFDDLLLNLLRILRERPDIRDRLATQFRYVLVDEYQDTNAIQAEIIRLISGSHSNILVVGDDAQSIYSFRAADVKNILSFPELFVGAQVFRLLNNYRSTPEILAFANNVIGHNQGQFKKDLHSMRAGVEKPNVVAAANPFEEASYIAQQVLALHDEGIAMREIAVLFRAAFHSQALEFELMKRDIPYEYRGGMKFFERAHVKDIVSHLRLIGNPKDEAAWMRVLSLQEGIGVATAGRIIDHAVRNNGSLVEILAVQSAGGGGRAAKGWEGTRNLLSKMLPLSKKPGDLIRTVASSSYREYLEAEYPDHTDRFEDLEQFARFADVYDDLKTFLDDVSLTDEFGVKRADEKKQENEEKIVLSTIHQAKGLEWEAVFVMHMADGKFPNPKAMGEEGGMEEERRLFYVACTRAKSRLFLTYPLVTGEDSFMMGNPSPFISEANQKLLEEVHLTRPKPSSFHSRSRAWHDGDDGPTIVLDKMGEKTAPPPIVRKSFLRDIDDLL